MPPSAVSQIPTLVQKNPPPLPLALRSFFQACECALFLHRKSAFFYTSCAFCFESRKTAAFNGSSASEFLNGPNPSLPKWNFGALSIKTFTVSEILVGRAVDVKKKERTNPFTKILF